MRLAVVIVCAVALAGCDSGPEVDARNASAQEVAEQVADAGGSDIFLRPGKWESRVQIEEFDLPGAPPEAKTAMRGMHEQAMVSESCLTPGEAERPKEDFFAGKDKNCRYDHFTMGNGKIDAAMKCTGEGMAQTTVMQGSYSPDAYQMRMSMKADAGVGPPGGMRLTMRVDAKRIGECDARKG